MKSRQLHRLSGQYGEVRGFRSDVNVTPLLDVVLMLLVIFMVSHTERALPSLLADLLSTSEEPNLSLEQPVILTVTGKGTIYVNGKLSKEANLETDLISATKGREIQVFLRGGKGVSYEAVVRVVNLLLSYGLGKVALVADSSVVADVGGSADGT
ncbi:ExbD/TolR family protein [Anaplasma capra]|uniref:ExbD/TolR family protein n=1 Tax=Anaplasma capra TaxID=1562740 RepID=UPI0021D60E71|nr:biopolymer transporter ExbD [Anaplasma capra]MCU7611380.1 biopolymer transporter ExbD [Anaplasma capra]MCU7612454.1 biopolymer transporter ExbD [Anaplasma capra]